jgi:hypothetical protein
MEELGDASGGLAFVMEGENVHTYP